MTEPTFNERLDGIEAANRKQRRSAVLGYVTLLAAVLAVYVTSQHDANQARDAIVDSGKVVSVAGCNKDFVTIEKVRGVFTKAIVAAGQQHDAGVTSNEQYADAKAFYAQQLVEFQLPDCRATAKILTDDPRQTHFPPPYPRYPGDGR